MTEDDLQQRLNQARNFLLSGDFARALPLYEQLTRSYPGIAVVWYECGNAAAKLRKLEQAERAWRRASDLDPKNAELIGMIGHQYQALRQSDKACACFARAAAAAPLGINPRISLAVLLEKTHLLEQARAAVD